MTLTRWPRFLRSSVPNLPLFFQGTEAERLFKLLPRQTRRLFNARPEAGGTEYPIDQAWQIEMEEHLGGLPESTLVSEDWLAGYRHLVSQGRFRLGGVFRAQAVRRALAGASSSAADKDTLTTGFCAALDQAQFETARGLLDRLETTKGVGRLSVTRLTGYLEMLSGNITGFHDCEPKPSEAEERGFLEYVGGRTVAMVGPAAGGARQGGEIDRFERIARSNHRGTEVNYDPLTAGSRTDFSFYQRRKLAALEAAGGTGRFFEWLRTIDWAVFKALEFEFQRDAIQTGKAIVRRWNQLFLHGHPNLVPSNLYTLLFYRVGRVKVFNSNFFLSSTPYAEGYKTDPRELADTLQTMASHDLISQVNFVRCLARAGLVELDDECAAVVAMPSHEYFAGLERVYPVGGVNMAQPLARLG